MDTKRTLAELNRLLSLEYAAYISYQTAASLVEGDHAPYWCGLLEKMSADELEHAKELRDRIVALGGIPTLEPAAAFADRDPKRFLAKALELERDAQKSYLALFKKIPLEHLVLRETIEHIAKDEQRAVEELERLLAPTKK